MACLGYVEIITLVFEWVFNGMVQTVCYAHSICYAFRLATKMFRNWSFVSLVKIKIGIEIKYYKFEIRSKFGTRRYSKKNQAFVRIFLIFPCVLDCLRSKSYPRTVKCDNVNAILVEIYGIIWYKIFSWGWSELLVWNFNFKIFLDSLKPNLKSKRNQK